jgi:hypothetical protein
MDFIDEFVQRLSKPNESEQGLIRAILEKVPTADAQEWISGVVIENGRVAGTYYEQIGNVLTFNDFLGLYGALGYDINAMSTWRGWWCSGALGCRQKRGYTCHEEQCP